MGTSNTGCFRVCIWVLCFAMAASLFKHCDARTSTGLVKAPKHETINQNKKLELMSTIMSLVVDQPTDTSDTNCYGVGSPFSLPPFDSLAPNSLPENAPPYCFNPPQTPSTAPIGTSSAPPTPVAYNIPAVIPNPPFYIPSPPGFLPRPPVFLPPIVYPPPTGPPPRSIAPITALWCVAKPSVPDPIIQEAMNYACGSGANCDSIQPSGPCFEPNALFAHASYAFNSYFQRTKRAGGTCDFGDTAILVTVDPSFDGCHFEYS